jgi:hypothetical protein
MNIGTQIISTKAFCPVDFKINDRNAGKDIGCFMRVYEMDSIADGFSWTNNVVQVYKHVIDHSLLADYYASKTRKGKELISYFKENYSWKKKYKNSLP